MFGRRKQKKAAAAAGSGNDTTKQRGFGKVVAGGGDGHHSRHISAATIGATTAADHHVSLPPVSPLQSGKFDFSNPFKDLPSPSASFVSSIRPKGSVENFSRPRTSDGAVAAPGDHSRAKSSLSLAPPVLPPIPRVASTAQKSDTAVSREPSWMADTEVRSNQSDAGAASSPKAAERVRDDADNTSVVSRPSSRKSTKSLKHQLSFEPVKELPPFAFQRPQTAGPSVTSLGVLEDDDNDEPVMSASVFPSVTNTQPLTASKNVTSASYVPGPAMNRAFIDSRDKAYPTMSIRPAASLPSSNSTPNLLSPASPAPLSAVSPSSLSKSPLSASSSTFAAGSQSSPQSTAMSSSIQLHKTPTNYSGSTARISHNHSQSSSTTKSSARNRTESTIGTPYSETSPSFPAPKFVSTRPRTSGGQNKVGGIDVPTHHTTSMGTPSPPPTEKAKDPPKKERRKTMLMNPMNLLIRRRTEETRPQMTLEEKSAQEAALRKQKKVAAVGVEKTPDNFDPSIRGKGVHDFSAPRAERRNTSYSFFSQDDNNSGSRPMTLQSTNSAPLMAGGNPSNDARQSIVSDDTQGSRRKRRSDHAPIFHEHLTESSPTGLLAAETRENKDFLQRVSGISSLSQESSVLPPFARRSQVLDAHQASLWNDADSSKRSSDPSTVGRERDSSYSGNSAVSPVTGRTSVANTDVLLRESMNSSMLISPQSERFSKSPAKSPSLSSGGRPVSDVSSLRSPRPTSIGVALQPSVEPIAEDSSVVSTLPPLPSLSNAIHLRTPSEQAPELHATLAHSRINSAEAPELAPASSRGASPHLAPSLEGQSALPSPVTSYFSGHSNSSTPEPMTVDSAIQMRQPVGPAQLVENRTSQQPLKVAEKLVTAVGHSSSKSLAPKHAKSNASRFSFQLGEDKNVEEERILEDKHRRIMNNKRSKQSLDTQAGGSRLDADDEDEDFDIEDAMDDLDEMELEEAAEQRQIGLTQGFLGSPSQMQTGHVPPAEKDRVVEDDASVYDDEHIPEVLDESQLGYFDHPAFRAHSALASHTRDGSFATLATLPSVMGGSTGSMRSGFSGWRGDVVDKFIDSYTNHTSSPSWGGGTIDEERPVSRGSPLSKVVQSNESTTSSGLSKEIAREDSTRQNGGTVQPVSPLDLVPPGETHEERKTNFYLQPKAAGASGWSSTWSVDKPPTSRGASSASRVSAVSAVSDKGSKALSSLHSSVKGDRARTMGSQSTKSRQSFASGATDSEGVYSSRASRRSRLKEKRRQTAGSEMALADLFGISGDWAGFHFGSELDLALGTQADDVHSDVPPIPKLPDSVARSDHVGASDGISLPVYSNADTEPQICHPPNVLPPPTGPPPPVPDQRRMTPDSETMPLKAANRNTASTNDTPSVRSTKDTWSDIGHSPAQPDTNTAAFAEVAVRTSDFDKQVQDDDLYFDDGAFAKEDLNLGPRTQSIYMDEDALDNEAYWQQRRSELSMAAPPLTDPTRLGHQRDLSGMTFTSMGSDGPYPSFAIPNATKAKERNSRMLLEDLPLLGPVDPRLIPQRNPSEDAKRLGLSNKVPPLPAPEGGSEASDRRMRAYQTALADAINKADAAGRFLRAPSVRTERSLSLYPTDDGDEDKSVYSQQFGGDGASAYSRDEEGALHIQPSPSDDDPARKPSNADTLSTEGKNSLFNHGINYSPPKPGFDFGFDASSHQSETPHDDAYHYDFAGSDYVFDQDDGMDDDDDLVAAANAEALALDDGTYGQEFDFYAKARPSSADAQAINGGYFGEDGDSGLARNKSIKEPNLTPITERSEFSTRNSFIGSLHGQLGPASTGFGANGAPASPALARLPISPLSEHETSLESLRKLRLSAFGGGSSASGGGSPTTNTATGGYFGNIVMTNTNAGLHGSSPMAYSNSERSSGSFHPQQYLQHGHDRNSPLRTSFYSNLNNGDDSPVSAGSGSQQQQAPYDPDATPKKTPLPPRNSMVSNGASGAGSAGHSRTGSDSVSYVKEHDPSGSGPPRWVLERRRTSEQGLEMLVDREVLGSGWI
ncbi:hypothetical protein K431DRAFT_295220 [Polychaeton citri CBS 116435]|uniref:Uncharacterized protein n=1 Tax=Polychaeton citri CBS 116435 TaxID=1314669 RepID=A0A9P4Q6A9_9PEZI|nr:hypothetical protein K431DRAFT_295220 [Polychaeton citri CBS 116435]